MKFTKRFLTKMGMTVLEAGYFIEECKTGKRDTRLDAIKRKLGANP